MAGGIKCFHIKKNKKTLMSHQHYSDVIKKALQESAPTSINMHKINEHFIMDIEFDNIVNSILELLDKNRYKIIKKD